MRLVTYNIYMGAFYQRGGDRLDQVCQLLADLRPDVLAVQECFGPHFSGLADPRQAVGVGQLEAATQLKATVFTAAGGNQLLLMTPPSWAVKRTVSHLGQNHGIGLVELDAGPYGGLTIGTVHLHPWSETERLQQLHWLQPGHSRTILMGDFNALAPDPYGLQTIQRLPDQYRDGDGPMTDVSQLLYDFGFRDAAVIAAGDRGPTYPTRTFPDVDGCPDIRIDFVRVSSDLVEMVKSCETLRTDAAERTSDHHPVIAILEKATPKA